MSLLRRCEACWSVPAARVRTANSPAFLAPQLRLWPPGHLLASARSSNESIPSRYLGNRDTNDGKRSDGGQHSWQMGRTASTSDNDSQAPGMGLGAVVDHFGGHPVGRDDVGFEGDAEFVQCFCGCPHHRPVGVRSHHNADLRSARVVGEVIVAPLLQSGCAPPQQHSGAPWPAVHVWHRRVHRAYWSATGLSRDRLCGQAWDPCRRCGS